jgi:MFS family permease
MVLQKILHAVIRNEAMKNDPQEVYGWRVFALVFSACFGGMLFGWETGAIGGILAMEPAQAKFGYVNQTDKGKSNLSQNIVSTLQAGCFAACFIVYPLADRYGRRWSLIGTGMFALVGVIFQAASAAHGNLAVMYVGRFLAGLGVGAASTLTPLYVSECAPRAIRGGLTCSCRSCSWRGLC